MIKLTKIHKSQILNYTVIKGGKFSTNIPVVAADITAEMLLSYGSINMYQEKK